MKSSFFTYEIFVKKIVPLIILFAINSCSKHKDEPATPELSVKGSIEFKLNGTLIRRDNDSSNVIIASCVQQAQSGPLAAMYLFGAEAGVLTSLNFPVVTDNLDLTNYHEDSASINKYFYYPFGADNNGQAALIFFKGDYFDVNITSYKNHRVSGTFSGKLTNVPNPDYFTRGSFVITDGIINNVPVF